MRTTSIVTDMINLMMEELFAFETSVVVFQ
jgi:hypothetical protein